MVLALDVVDRNGVNVTVYSKPRCLKTDAIKSVRKCLLTGVKGSLGKAATGTVEKLMNGRDCWEKPILPQETSVGFQNSRNHKRRSKQHHIYITSFIVQDPIVLATGSPSICHLRAVGMILITSYPNGKG